MSYNGVKSEGLKEKEEIKEREVKKNKDRQREKEKTKESEKIRDKDSKREKDYKEKDRHRSKHHHRDHRDSDRTKRHNQDDRVVESHRYSNEPPPHRHETELIKEKHRDRDRSRSYTSMRDQERRKRHHRDRNRSKSIEKTWHSERERRHPKKKDTDSSDKEDRIKRSEKHKSLNGDQIKHKSKKDSHRHKTDRSHSYRRESQRSRSRIRGSSKDIEQSPHRNRSRSRSIPQDTPPKRTWRFDSPPKSVGDFLPVSLNTNIPQLNTFLTSNSSLTSVTNSIPNIPSSVPFATNAHQLTTSILENSPSSSNSLTNLAAAIGLDANATKAARELYVGNLPPGIDVNQLLEFLNAAMVALKASTMPGNTCNKAWISTDGHYAFVEFRTLEEASNGMQLNGLNCLGYSLRIGRPKTYPPELAALVPQPTAVALDSSYLAQGIAGVRSGMEAASGLIGSGNSALVAAQKAANIVASSLGFANYGLGGNKIDRMCIMGLPPELPEEKVKSLVTTFGNVKFFQLLIKEDGTSSGVCICDFQDYESQQQAIEILTQNTSYVVMKACDAVDQGLLADFVPLQIQSDDSLLKPQVPTRVIMLCNLVTREELLDETEYEEIVEDVRLECANYGTVVSLVIPKPIRGFSEEEVDQSDVGFAFVEFSNTDGSAKARKALSGRKFAKRIVEAHYFSEIKYSQKDFKHPVPNFDKQHSTLYNPELAQNQLENNS